MKKSTEQSSCNQCGECCTNGGAALHSADRELLRNKLIPLSDLITIRKGEFAHNPVNNRIQATRAEIVKLRGGKGEWVCCYYDRKTKSCTIYDKRPLACRTLKCWDPAESLDLVEKDLLSRFDILEGEDFLLGQVTQYEEICPVPDFTTLSQDLKTEKRVEKWLSLLEEQVNRDLQFRDQAVGSSTVIEQQELFLFGRPLFQLLQPFGFAVFQSGSSLCLKHK